ncbi:MAG: response regulator transcription factor [Caulobacter sp.]|nr:response regulator transcription factor [Caulobacter sp.]
MSIPLRATPGVSPKIWREGLVILGGAVVLIALGPFGAVPYRDVAGRTLYWARTLAGGYLLLRPCLALASLAARRWRVSELAAWTAAALLAGLPMVGLVWWLGPRPDLARPPPSPADFLDAYLQVMTITALVAPALWLARRAGRPAPSAPQATGNAPPALARRLPPGQGQILALSMEDHYVRVHAAAGQTLLLMRMADAVALMDGQDGARVHRSWWVARAAVEGFRRDGRRVWLRARGDLLVPVARGRVRALASEGWPLGGRS